MVGDASNRMLGPAGGRLMLSKLDPPEAGRTVERHVHTVSRPSASRTLGRMRSALIDPWQGVNDQLLNRARAGPGNLTSRKLLPLDALSRARERGHVCTQSSQVDQLLHEP